IYEGALHSSNPTEQTGCPMSLGVTPAITPGRGIVGVRARWAICSGQGALWLSTSGTFPFERRGRPVSPAGGAEATHRGSAGRGEQGHQTRPLFAFSLRFLKLPKKGGASTVAAAQPPCGRPSTRYKGAEAGRGGCRGLRALQ